MTLRENGITRAAIGSIVCDSVDYSAAEQIIAQFVRTTTPHLVLTPNIAHVWQANHIPAVAEAYRKVSLSTPDGWPLVLAMRVLGVMQKRRVTGSDLTPLLCRGNYRIVIVGGKRDSAERAAQELRLANPGLDVAAVERADSTELADPEERARLIDRVCLARADLIFLGIGVPKQEALALDLLDQLSRGVVLCVGATVEFLAGTTRRSPEWMRVGHVEWLYRLALEPRRLFRRYATALPYFAAQVARAKLNQLLQKEVVLSNW